MVQINYQNQTSYKMEEYLPIFNKIARYTLKQFDIKGKVEVSLTLVSKNTIREINKTYRKIDKVTDVISFENDEGFEKYDGFITLGDLFICVSKAKSQAKSYGHSMYREVCFLFVHGLLHLLKMDHMNEDDAKKMFKMQDDIMDHFKIVR
ncbi:MAG: rRNA maturation RNase YbeY [Candidatus Caccosoma sp.]|nr:rRNA maturation RNase YbeY [Candidatus Caccosoma sp.]